MQSETNNMAKYIAEVLAPCMSDPPTAGAVIVFHDASGASYTTLNMGSFEAAHVLRATVEIIERSMGGNLETLQ